MRKQCNDLNNQCMSHDYFNFIKKIVFTLLTHLEKHFEIKLLFALFLYSNTFLKNLFLKHSKWFLQPTDNKAMYSYTQIPLSNKWNFCLGRQCVCVEVGSLKSGIVFRHFMALCNKTQYLNSLGLHRIFRVEKIEKSYSI